MRLDKVVASRMDTYKNLETVRDQLAKVGNDYVNLAENAQGAQVTRQTGGVFSRFSADVKSFFSKSEQAKNQRTLESFRELMHKIPGMEKRELAFRDAVISNYGKTGKPITGRQLAYILDVEINNARDALRPQHTGYALAKAVAENMTADTVADQAKATGLTFNDQSLDAGEAEKLLPEVKKHVENELFAYVNEHKSVPPGEVISQAYRKAIAVEYVKANLDAFGPIVDQAKLSGWTNGRQFVSDRVADGFMAGMMRDPELLPLGKDFDVGKTMMLECKRAVRTAYLAEVKPQIKQCVEEGLKPGGALLENIAQKVSAAMPGLSKAALANLANRENIDTFADRLSSSALDLASKNPGCYSKIGNDGPEVQPDAIMRAINEEINKHFASVDTCMKAVSTQKDGAVPLSNKDLRHIFEQLSTNFGIRVKPQYMNTAAKVLINGVDNLMEQVTGKRTESFRNCLENLVRLRDDAVRQDRIMENGAGPDDIFALSHLAVNAGIMRYDSSDASSRIAQLSRPGSPFLMELAGYVQDDSVPPRDKLLALDICNALASRLEILGPGGKVQARTLRAVYSDLAAYRPVGQEATAFAERAECHQAGVEPVVLLDNSGETEADLSIHPRSALTGKPRWEAMVKKELTNFLREYGKTDLETEANYPDWSFFGACKRDIERNLNVMINGENVNSIESFRAGFPSDDTGKAASILSRFAHQGLVPLLLDADDSIGEGKQAMMLAYGGSPWFSGNHLREFSLNINALGDGKHRVELNTIIDGDGVTLEERDKKMFPPEPMKTLFNRMGFTIDTTVETLDENAFSDLNMELVMKRLKS